MLNIIALEAKDRNQSGREITNCKDLGSGYKKYLFFNDKTLVSIGLDKEHKDILGGRRVNEILVAGGYNVIGKGIDIAVNGDGSTGLQIESRDPAPVVEYIKSFADSAGRDIYAV